MLIIFVSLDILFFPICACKCRVSVFRFEDKENISGVNNAKSSVQRGVKAAVLEQFPFIEPYMDQVLPKKDALKLVKW